MLLIVRPLCAVIIDYTAQGERSVLAQLPSTFIITRLVVDADVPVDLDEFFYLTGLKEKNVTSACAINNACFYLKQSCRWRAIQLQVCPEQDGMVMIFTLKGHWLVQSVDVNGIW